jgi:serine/threonine-protein kinase
VSDPIETVKAEELLGQVLDGRYRVDAVLGAGGMGMVFKGMQTSMGRPIALKTLHPQLAMAPTFFERFRREAEIASRLKHPNIITIYDFGRTADGLCYFVMEYLEGESLRQRVKRQGAMTLREAVAVLEQVALGLGHAHQAKVIHRDIKPHNIMISEVDGSEYVKVLDFGLVKAIEEEEEEHLTSTGQVLGTPQYMPPEQAGGEVVDQRSDLYSLTGVLYYCLTGHSPFGANTVRKALTASLTGKVPPIATYRVGAPVPPALDEFVARGLMPEKDDRFQTADEFIANLQASVKGLTDAQLDAAPEFVADASKDPGSGSSSASRKSSSASRSRPPSKAVSAVSRALPKSSSSRIEVAEQTPPSMPSKAPPPKQGSSLVVIVAGVAAAVVLVGVGVAWKMTRGDDKPAVVVVTSGPPVPVKPPVEPAPRVATTVKVTLTTTPAGAEVVEDKVMVGVTPLTLDWPRGTTRTLSFRLANYKPVEKVLRPETDQALDFALESAKPAAGQPPVKPKPKKEDDGIGAFE